MESRSSEESISQQQPICIEPAVSSKHKPKSFGPSCNWEVFWRQLMRICRYIHEPNRAQEAKTCQESLMVFCPLRCISRKLILFSNIFFCIFTPASIIFSTLPCRAFWGKKLLLGSQIETVFCSLKCLQQRTPLPRPERALKASVGHTL